MAKKNLETMIEELCSSLAGRVSVLAVDDQRPALDSVRALLRSPLFNLVEAQTFETARETILHFHTPWHLWLIDFDLDGGHTGLELMALRPRYQQVIVLSGLGSMRLAQQALNRGAWKVHDKDAQSLGLVLDDISTIAAVGCLVQGTMAPSRELVERLFSLDLADHKEWAYEMGLSTRSLERLCASYFAVPPRLVLPFFTALVLCLRRVDSSGTIAESYVESLSRSRRNHLQHLVTKAYRNRERLCRCLPPPAGNPTNQPA